MSLDAPTQITAMPSASEQSQFLLHLIQRANKEVTLTTAEQLKIAALEQDCANILAAPNAATTQLADIRDKIKRFIPELEISRFQKLVTHFQENGLYRMFYHKARIKGQRNTSDLNKYLKSGFAGVALSIPAVALFAATSMLGAPTWTMPLSNGLFASAMIYLSALAYGITNDIYATAANLPYFLFGHQPKQHSLIETNDPIAQGVAWGVAATYEPALAAAIIFGIATTITAAFAPIPNIIFPIGLSAMPLLAKVVDLHAAREMQKKIELLSDFPDDAFSTGSNEYQRNASSILQTTKQEYAAYRANSDRNSFGFSKVPYVGVGMLVMMLILSVAHSILPSSLFSTTATTLLPITVACISIIAISALGIYTYINRNKQIDNRFKLAFDQELDADLDELYLDEDLLRIQEFTQKQTPATSCAPIQEIKSVTRYFDMKAAQQADVEIDNVQHGPSHLRTKAAVSA